MLASLALSAAAFSGQANPIANAVRAANDMAPINRLTAPATSSHAFPNANSRPPLNRATLSPAPLEIR